MNDDYLKTQTMGPLDHLKAVEDYVAVSMANARRADRLQEELAYAKKGAKSADRWCMTFFVITTVLLFVSIIAIIEWWETAGELEAAEAAIAEREATSSSGESGKDKRDAP